MKDEVIESKTYRRNSYDIIYDGKKYYLLRRNSIGIPEVMTYHESLEEAKIAFNQLFKKQPAVVV
ncbi:MAG: hypothetical protein WCR08_13350 [Gammaproteobacteria bacterium]